LAAISDAALALVGGAAGALLAAAARALNIPTEVRSVDAAIRSRDEALAIWIADRNFKLRRDCESLRASAIDPTRDEALEALTGLAGNEREGSRRATDRAIADAKTQALLDYREATSRAVMDREVMLVPEGWAHRRWRALTRTPPPQLTTPTEAVPLLDAWRKPSGLSGERWTFPDDPTLRTLGDAIARMPVSGP